MLNWIVLVVGLALIGLFWHFISPEERKKETHIVAGVFLVLGVVVYFLQSTFV
ncbi:MULTISPECIES: hypothetical protein [unclassified Flavonifractor]|uniref:hypothetical protein n=1 Tax=Flavonifractor sp. An92 TaxID=1965666 RepID=UPI001302288A|nr:MULTISPECIES: hypothetical protein [unclassified Flavonifractor]